MSINNNMSEDSSPIRQRQEEDVLMEIQKEDRQRVTRDKEREAAEVLLQMQRQPQRTSVIRDGRTAGLSIPQFGSSTSSNSSHEPSFGAPVRIERSFDNELPYLPSSSSSVSKLGKRPSPMVVIVTQAQGIPTTVVNLQQGMLPFSAERHVLTQGPSSSKDSFKPTPLSETIVSKSSHQQGLSPLYSNLISHLTITSNPSSPTGTSPSSMSPLISISPSSNFSGPINLTTSHKPLSDPVPKIPSVLREKQAFHLSKEEKRSLRASMPLSTDATKDIDVEGYIISREFWAKAFVQGDICHAAGIMFKALFSEEEIRNCTLRGRNGTSLLSVQKRNAIFRAVGWMKQKNQNPYSFHTSNPILPSEQLTPEEKMIIEKKVFVERRYQTSRKMRDGPRRRNQKGVSKPMEHDSESSSSLQNSLSENFTVKTDPEYLVTGYNKAENAFGISGGAVQIKQEVEKDASDDSVQEVSVSPKQAKVMYDMETEK